MHNPIMAQLEDFRLRVFRAAAEHLNFHKAAGRLFLTHPAVTLQIRAMESDLGVRPFRKSFLNATRFRFADVRQRSRGNGFRSEYSVSPELGRYARVGNAIDKRGGRPDGP